MNFFCKRQEDGTIFMVGKLPDGAQVPEGFEPLAQEKGEAWLAERRAAWEESGGADSGGGDRDAER